MSTRVGEPEATSVQAADNTVLGVRQTTTIPAARLSVRDSDAVIDLPPSLRVVPGPDAVTFCGFLDAEEAVLEAHEFVSGAPPRSAPARRPETVLPPPLCTEDDFDEDIIYPPPER